MNRHLLLLSLLGLSAGCAAATAPKIPFTKVPPNPDKAVIYLYRPAGFVGSALMPKVSCGSETVALGPGNYHAFIAAPGHVQCASSYYENSAAVDLDLKPGQDYYVKQTSSMGFFVGHVHLATVAPDYGLQETSACSQVQ